MNHGYHYTSLANWQRIKTEGLIPYRLSDPVPYSNRDALAHLAPVDGIWVWMRESPGEESHIGNILFQANTKGTNEVVHIRVDFPAEDVLQDKRGNTVGVLVFRHSGAIEEWTYHMREPAVIVTKPIPPSRIELLGTYDIPAMASEARGEPA